jgi:hypothetical protein
MESTRKKRKSTVVEEEEQHQKKFAQILYGEYEDETQPADSGVRFL